MWECRFAEMFIKMLVLLSVGYNASPVEDKCNSGNLQDGVGVYVPGYDMYFGCEYLRDNLTNDRNVGIYKNRDDYCNSVTTDCCATCDEIRCKDVGIVLAETPFECKYLLMDDPAYSRLGIYKDREKLCQQKTTTECCQTCKKVKNATGSFSSTVGLTPTETKQTNPSPQQTTNPNLVTEIEEPELQDECVNHCIHMGDGSFGTCEWLREMEDNTFICMNGFAVGCKKTCRDILTKAYNTQSSRTTTPDNQTFTVTDSDCADSFVVFEDNQYDCFHLVDPNSDIFHMRSSLCASNGHFCCLTCKIVQKEESSNVIKYNEENTGSDNKDVVVATMNLSTRIPEKIIDKEADSSNKASTVDTNFQADHSVMLKNMMISISEQIQRTFEKVHVMFQQINKMWSN